MHYAITNQNGDSSHQPVEYFGSVQFGVCPKIFILTPLCFHNYAFGRIKSLNQENGENGSMSSSRYNLNVNPFFAFGFLFHI